MAIKTEKITINLVGENSGESFAGTFEIYLSLPLGKRLELDQYRRAYLGNQGNVMLSAEVDLVEKLANIRARVVLNPKDEPIAPRWWTESQFGLSLEDENVVTDIYNKMQAALEKRKTELKAERDASRTALAKAEPAEATPR